MKILIIEDDELTAETVVAILADQNYAVEIAADGQIGWELVEAFNYDLIVLDVTLPKIDGISLCRQLRLHNYKMPILLLTGHDSSHDKAVGLDAGADDYVVKPFDPEELTARIRALLRRGSLQTPGVLEQGDLKLDPSSCEVFYANKPLSLTPKEYALLELFLRNPHRVFSCGMILEHLWTFEDTPGEEAVRTHIKGLRQKLKAVGAATDLIETVYGIGYRLKTIKTTALETKTETTSTAKTASTKVEIAEVTRRQTLALIGNVWERHKLRVIEQVDLLEQVITDHQQWLNPDLYQQAKQEAHTLAGSLGTFGLSKGSKIARKIEQYLQEANPATPPETARLSRLIIQLRQDVEHYSPEGSSDPSQPIDDRPLLLIIDPDPELADILAVEAASRGLRTEIAADLTKAKEKLGLNQPSIVLFDPATSSIFQESLALLEAFSKQTPPMPVVIFTAEGSLNNRLSVAQFGGRTFLQKPLQSSQVIEMVVQVLRQADNARAKVMVVDDDPKVLAILKTLLEPWGLKITTLADPQRFWETLEATSPDLLVLDVEMPHWNGIELCQVVRNDSRWNSLPIMFLTVHTDTDTVHRIFTAGADDFVSKPIAGPELVTRLINRLERIKLLQSLVEIDTVTGISNRRKATQDLEKLFSLAKRQKQSLCLAILDIDHFEQINDDYGHATGDEVLYHVGQLLRQSFRAEDVVGRWSGEEFVIGMYGITQAEGMQRLTQVLKKLHQTELIAQNKTPFHITASMGAAQFPESASDLRSLYQEANQALHHAKLAERERCSTAENASLKNTSLKTIRH